MCAGLVLEDLLSGSVAMFSFLLPPLPSCFAAHSFWYLLVRLSYSIPCVDVQQGHAYTAPIN